MAALGHARDCSDSKVVDADKSPGIKLLLPGWMPTHYRFVLLLVALQDYVAQHGAPGRENATAAGRAPTRVLGHSASRS